MKKFLACIMLTVLIICLAAACSAENGNSEISTTAVTDTAGQTRYYAPVTNANKETVTVENGGAVFAEIETDPYGTPVTDRGGEYVTADKTTVFQPQNTADNTAGNPENGAGSGADNEIPFEPGGKNTTAATAERTTTTTTTAPQTTDPGVTTTQPATDPEGWINKWY